jgi:BsaWI restriction endonuclease type 2
MSLHLDAGNNRLVIFGGVHVKASLAERVSDDVPASRAMMGAGYYSPLWTLDVKSFPPPRGDLINRGELGSPANPSVKRGYIEEHGEFDACYSANARSVPSLIETPSGKRIYRIRLNEQPDQFIQDVIARAALARQCSG